MTQIELLPELNFLSELYAADRPEAILLAEYPSSNSEDTIFQNKTKYIIHDPFPPPPSELLKVLGPHHLMCGWGNCLGVTSQLAPPQVLLDHWANLFGELGCPNWQTLDDTSSYITLFAHQSIPAERQQIDPAINYAIHSKEVIEKIACPQATVLPTCAPSCIVKLSHGYAGLGNFMIRDESDIGAMYEQLTKHWPEAVLVANSIIENVVRDVGVQFYLRKDGSKVWLGFTEQQFDQNKRWCGGTYSAGLQIQLYDDLCKIIDPAGDFLHSQGYFGVVGIDILQDSSGNLFLVDVNPRLTGNSPFLIASRIFHRDQGLTEGVYQASVQFKGSYEELIAAAENTKDAKVCVVSAFEDKALPDPMTVCHLAVSSESQTKNQEILSRILGI